MPEPGMSDKHDGKRSKIDALKEEGSLNPAPEKLHDPKFPDSEFFDPHDIVQVRYEMLRRVSVDKASVTQVADEYGVSRPTYYQAKAGFDAAGIAGLAPAKPGPRGPHKIDDAVLAFLQARLLPGEPIRARELAKLVHRELDIDLHPRTIERALKKPASEDRRPVGGLLHGHGGAVRSAARRRLWRRSAAGGSKRPSALSAPRHVGMGAGPDSSAARVSRADIAVLGSLAVYA